MTHTDAARLLGARTIATLYRPPKVRSFSMPLGGDFPLVSLGELLSLALDAKEQRSRAG